jgi:hypothetical protein
MSGGKTWLWRLFLPGFVALVTMGLWLPPIITHAVEKDYHFPEVEIDATVLPNGDMVLEGSTSSGRWRWTLPTRSRSR